MKSTISTVLWPLVCAKNSFGLCLNSIKHRTKLMCHQFETRYTNFWWSTSKEKSHHMQHSSAIWFLCAIVHWSFLFHFSKIPGRSRCQNKTTYVTKILTVAAYGNVLHYSKILLRRRNAIGRLGQILISTNSCNTQNNFRNFVFSHI